MPTMIRTGAFRWQIDNSVRRSFFSAHLGFVSFIDFFGVRAVIVLNRVINAIADIVVV
jgi:hypothetical protein